MARIAGIDLPNEKRIDIGLTYIYGIGRVLAKQILAETEIDPATRVKDLGENDIAKLRVHIEKNHNVEGELRKNVAMNIKSLVEINSFRGTRHRKGLPSRGQNTRTNSRTRKGPRRVVSGSSKKGK